MCTSSLLPLLSTINSFLWRTCSHPFCPILVELSIIISWFPDHKRWPWDRIVANHNTLLMLAVLIGLGLDYSSSQANESLSWTLHIYMYIYICLSSRKSWNRDGVSLKIYECSPFYASSLPPLQCKVDSLPHKKTANFTDTSTTKRFEGRSASEETRKRLDDIAPVPGGVPKASSPVCPSQLCQSNNYLRLLFSLFCSSLYEMCSNCF